MARIVGACWGLEWGSFLSHVCASNQVHASSSVVAVWATGGNSSILRKITVYNGSTDFECNSGPIGFVERKIRRFGTPKLLLDRASWDRAPESLEPRRFFDEDAMGLDFARADDDRHPV